jgi:hypothetical protein
MEQAIGDLGSEIQQPSNIYGNLRQSALRRSQLNALKKICPELDLLPSLPNPYHDCGGGGFILLHPMSCNPVVLEDTIATVVFEIVGKATVRKWGCLQLSNGQIARSIFAENEYSQISRNVKVS